MIEISGNNRLAFVSVSFETARHRLEENPFWGAEVLTLSGDYDWQIAAARLYSQGFFGARIIEEKEGNSFIAWGISGHKRCLAYRIRLENQTTLQVVPLEYLEPRRKVGLSIALACAFILPVLISPLIWKLYAMETHRSSRILLPEFCRYLEMS